MWSALGSALEARLAAPFGSRRRARVHSGPPVSLALVMASVALVLAATLQPTYGVRPGEGGLCFTCGELWLADFIANVLLFLPLGAALAARGRRVLWVALTAFGLSAGVELLQHFVPGRSPVLRDVLANGAGAALGAALVAHARRWIVPGHAWRAPMGAAALIAGLALVIGSTWLRQPAMPPGPLVVSWNEGSRPGESGYPGAVVSARLGAHELGDGDRVAGWAVADFLRGAESLELSAEAAPARREARTLFSLLNFAGNPVLEIDVAGSEMLVRARSRGSRLGLAPVTLALDLGGAGTTSAGGRLGVVLAREGSRLCASAATGTSCRPLAALEEGWTLFHAGTAGRLPGMLVGIAWLVLLFAPAGVWLGLAREGRPNTLPWWCPSLCATAAVIVGLAAAGWFIGTDARALVAVAAAASGLALGRQAGPWLARTVGVPAAAPTSAEARAVDGRVTAGSPA